MIRIQEYNPNLTEIAERVLLGPQADILEKINQFNNYYQTNLKCTKMFRWSPGVSQQVKEAYERFILRWDMKYGGVEQFFKRIENRDYTHKNMARMLNDINNRMSGLRREGLSMQDNGDLVAEAFINTKEHILKELKLLEEVIDSSKFLINIYIEENDEGIDYYVIKIVMRDYIMEVVDDHGKLADIPLYPVALECKFSVFDHINMTCSGRDRTGNVQYYGEYMAPSDTLKFTFIANWNHNSSNGMRIVCLGGLDGDIKGATYRFNITGLAILLEQWIGRFHKDKTQPHNQPNKLFFGAPKWLKEQDSYDTFLAAYPTTKQTGSCGVVVAVKNLEESKRDFAIRNDNTCNQIECVLRASCEYYTNVVNIDEDRLTNLFYVNTAHELLYNTAFMHRNESLLDQVENIQKQELIDAIPVVQGEDPTHCPHDISYDEPCDCCEYEQIEREEAEANLTDEQRSMRWVEQQIERRNNG